MNIELRLILFMFLTLTLVSGCNHRDKQNDRNYRVEWAYHLVDQKHYSDAIYLFNDILRDEDSPDVRLGLASAYAARAGVEVQAYWDFIFPALKNPAPQDFQSTEHFKNQWNDIQKQLPNDIALKLDSKKDEVFKAHYELESLKWRLQKIPLITNEEQRQDIELARVTIKDLPSKGAHLYRALLTMILIRSDLNHLLSELSTSTSTNIASQHWPCPFFLRDWINTLPATFEKTQDLIEDVKVAFPKKQSELINFQNQFQINQLIISNTLQGLDIGVCSGTYN